MTTVQRLDSARQEIARRRDLSLAATPGPWCFYNGQLWRGKAEDLARYDADPDNPALDWDRLNVGSIFCGDVDREADAEHIAAAADPLRELAVLELHDQVLAAVTDDSWLLSRLTRPRPGYFTSLVAGLLDLYTPAADQPAPQTQEAST